VKDGLVVIVGPTAVGKSGIGIKLAQAVGGEIISGDSVQVYRKLNIGSAKVSSEEQQGVVHHMLDILDPDQAFSVSLFQERVRDLIGWINRRGKVPILVGGTGLYVRSVLDPYDFPDADSSQEIRRDLHLVVEKKGKGELHRMLAEVDPESSARLHPNDVTRVVRALEIFRLTGKPSSSFRRLPEDMSLNDSPYKLSFFGLNAPRDILYERINRRVDLMLQQGLVQEVEGLLQQGYRPGLPSLQSIGYRHTAQYLLGHLTFGEMVRLLKRDTRHFAKRQLTWFRRDPRINWYDVTSLPQELIVRQMAESICSA